MVEFTCGKCGEKFWVMVILDYLPICPCCGTEWKKNNDAND